MISYRCVFVAIPLTLFIAAAQFIMNYLSGSCMLFSWIQNLFLVSHIKCPGALLHFLLQVWILFLCSSVLPSSVGPVPLATGIFFLTFFSFDFQYFVGLVIFWNQTLFCTLLFQNIKFVYAIIKMHNFDKKHLFVGFISVGTGRCFAL